MKHNYLSILKEYKRVLKQRNALLKVHAPYNQFVPWNKQLSQLGNQLHVLRSEYFLIWEKEFSKVLIELSDLDCKITYFKGWDKKGSGKHLEEILSESFDSDKQKSYTQYGAHQADIFIEVCDNKAKNYLSRGQQKIILIALKLSQANFLSDDCIYLIDDLHAELDEIHQRKLMSFLSNRKGQYVITSNTIPNKLINYIYSDDYLAYEIEKGILKKVSRETQS